MSTARKTGLTVPFVVVNKPHGVLLKTQCSSQGFYSCCLFYFYPTAILIVKVGFQEQISKKTDMRKRQHCICCEVEPFVRT